MADPFIGQVVAWGGNFAPRNWAFCDGQLLPIAQNTALFSILGTTYGGDGRTTFGLPDLRGRLPMHPGSGPGLNQRRLGQKLGVEAVTLTAGQMPVHSHSVPASRAVGDQQSPENNVMAVADDGERNYALAANLQSAGTSKDAGGSSPHNNMQPYLAVSFIIALQGTYPSRS